MRKALFLRKSLSLSIKTSKSTMKSKSRSIAVDRSNRRWKPSQKNTENSKKNSLIHLKTNWNSSPISTSLISKIQKRPSPLPTSKVPTASKWKMAACSSTNGQAS